MLSTKVFSVIIKRRDHRGHVTSREEFEHGEWATLCRILGDYIERMRAPHGAAPFGAFEIHITGGPQ